MKMHCASGNGLDCSSITHKKKKKGILRLKVIYCVLLVVYHEKCVLVHYV